MPRVINVDKNAAYPPAVDDLKADEQLPETTELRQVKYLNNRVEQDHRFIKMLSKPLVHLFNQSHLVNHASQNATGVNILSAYL